MFGINNVINIKEVESIVFESLIMVEIVVCFGGMFVFMFLEIDLIIKIVLFIINFVVRINFVRIRKFKVKLNNFKNRKVCIIEIGMVKVGIRIVCYFFKNKISVINVKMMVNLRVLVIFIMEFKIKFFLFLYCIICILSGVVFF